MPSSSLSRVTPLPPAPLTATPGLVAPAHIDWDYYRKRRPRLLKSAAELPAYLLLPEVTALLSAVSHDVHHFLLNTLWHTGGRISEVLALKEGDFQFDGRHVEVALPTLKQRRGRPSKSRPTPPRYRQIPILDGDYIDEALRYFATHRRGRTVPLFNISRATADRWLNQAVADLDAHGQALSIPVSCHTLRHSFAVNALLHHVDVAIVQHWLGHKDRRSTEVYTQVLNPETAHIMARVAYR